MRVVQLGDHVRVQYSRLRSQPSEGDKPSPLKVLEFTAGSRDVMPGLSSGVVGMAPGEEKRLTLQPADAFGQIKPGLIKEIPRGHIPKKITLRVGKRLSALSTRSGRQRRVRIVEIGPKSVKVDGNHVLAGKVVVLDVQLISVGSPAEANGE